MKRIAVILLVSLALSVPVWAGTGTGSATGAGPAHDDYKHLIHKWKQVKAEGEFKLVSTYPAPVPFSMNGAPEATLDMSAEKRSPGMSTLADIVKGEVAGIRKQLQIADYDEKDGKKPVDGIATWYETINGNRVAFIKYRVAGVIGGPSIVPITVIHSILFHGDDVYYTHLMVRFAEHQDEVRHDQLVLVHAELSTPIHHQAQAK